MNTPNNKCPECQETEHKLWCSKYEGLMIDPVEREAEKQLDTTYKEEMEEIAKALKEKQNRTLYLEEGRNCFTANIKDKHNG